MNHHSDSATTPRPVAAAAPVPLWRRAAGEFIGTGALTMIIIGSGIAASLVSSDNGVQLLGTSLATALGLAVLIPMLQQVSGGHINPSVTLAERAVTDTRRGPGEIASYIVAQCLGALAGAVVANAMFEIPVAIATQERSTPGHLLAEVVSTAGLVLVIFALARSGRPGMIGPAVGAYIGAGFWFASSGAFANPAVTLGRLVSDTFGGTAPASVLAYIGAELVGTAVGVLLVLLLFGRPVRREG